MSFAVLMSSLAQAQLRTLTERERDVMLEGAQKTWVKKAQQFEGILSELVRVNDFHQRGGNWWVYFFICRIQPNFRASHACPGYQIPVGR